MANAELLAELDEARETSDEFALVQCLLQLIEHTPLFIADLSRLERWLIESSELSQRAVVSPRQEALQVVRRAELFLAKGLAREAYDLAKEATAVAARHNENLLSARSEIARARAMIRLTSPEEALRIIDSLGEHDVSEFKQNGLPGLALLTMGEAHLFDNRYGGAKEPLSQAIELLPVGAGLDCARYDSHVALGLLNHLGGTLDESLSHYKAALEIAEDCGAVVEQVQSQLFAGCLQRCLGNPVDAHQHFEKALALSATELQPAITLAFPTTRLRNLSGSQTFDEMLSRASGLAASCGKDEDLMGYVQITALVGALLSHTQQDAEAHHILTDVGQNLADDGQSEAADVLMRHARIYTALRD